MPRQQSFVDQCAVVTGGASGIGRALCGALLERGAARVIVADCDSDGARQVAEELAARGAGHATAAHVDVTQAQSVQALVDSVERGGHGSPLEKAVESRTGDTRQVLRRPRHWAFGLPQRIQNEYFSRSGGVPILRRSSSRRRGPVEDEEDGLNRVGRRFSTC